MLTRRALTVRELCERLRKKGADRETAEDVSHSLDQDGYINEKGIIEDHIQRGRNDRRMGRFLLRYELTQRGCNGNEIEAVLESMYPEEEEITAARQFTIIKLRTMPDLPQDKRIRRLGAALHRRGFNGETVAAIMDEVIRGEVKTTTMENSC